MYWNKKLNRKLLDKKYTIIKNERIDKTIKFSSNWRAYIIKLRLA